MEANFHLQEGDSHFPLGPQESDYQHDLHHHANLWKERVLMSVGSNRMK